MSPRHTNYSGECLAVRDVLSRVGDKWSVLIVGLLDDGPMRFNALRRPVESLDAKQLQTSAPALRGLLATFSTNTARAAEILEQMGVEGRADEATEPFHALTFAVQSLRIEIPTLTIKKLRSMSHGGGKAPEE